MPFIRMDEIDKLIEVENHLGEIENWSEYTYKLWEVIETLLQRHKETNARTVKYIMEKRKIDKNYGRTKNKSERAKQNEINYQHEYYMKVTKVKRAEKRKDQNGTHRKG